ncbi:acetylxylan esterase [Streptomyces sp. SID13666]|nr:acetylxylan esterase [Streptomyces sp. SID13666]
MQSFMALFVPRLDACFEPVDTGLAMVTVYDVTFAGYSGHLVKGWLKMLAAAEGLLPLVVEFAPGDNAMPDGSGCPLLSGGCGGPVWRCRLPSLHGGGPGLRRPGCRRRESR